MKNLNYTQIPNEFLDEKMSEITGEACKIFFAICRKTIGWHKTTDYVSYSQLKKITGIKHHLTLKKSIELLQKLGLINIKNTKKGKLYDININDTMSPNDIVESNDLCHAVTWGVSPNDTDLCHQMTPQKKKETIQKKPCDSSTEQSQIPLKLFCEKFEKQFKTKYQPSWGKDNKIIKTIFKGCENDIKYFCELIDEFFKVSKENNYVIKNYGYTITTFKTVLNVCITNQAMTEQGKLRIKQYDIIDVKKSTEPLDLKKLVQAERRKL